MAGDRHDLGALGGFLIEPVELIHRALVEMRGRVILRGEHHDIMDLEIIGQGHHRLVRGRKRHRLVVQHPVADIFDAGLAQIIERVEGLRQTRPEPAARALAGELLDHLHRLLDGGALVIELVHRDLLIAMRVQLPARFQAGLHHLRIAFADPGVERHGRRGADPLQHGLHAPEADPHAVFVPAPVRMVGEERLQLRRHDHHARHRARNVPVLQRQHRPDHHADAVRQFQRRTGFDRRKGETLARLHGWFSCLFVFIRGIAVEDGVVDAFCPAYPAWAGIVLAQAGWPGQARP